MDHTQSQNLPEALSRYIDDDKLQENAGNYDVMRRNFSDNEHMAIAAIRAIFLNLDLSHATYKPLADFDNQGILPESIIRKGRYSNTLPLDESLGLNQYTFMHWGAFDHATGYGKNIIGINTENILLSPNTLASPADIADTVFAGRNLAYPDLTTKDKQSTDNYLNSLVIGKDWLEIISRKALLRMRHSNEDIFRLSSPRTLGEVKHYGTITSDNFTSKIESNEQEFATWKIIIESGFAPGPVSNALAEVEKFGEVTSTKYNKLPHQVGADIKKSRAIWSHIRSISNGEIT